MSFLQNMWIKRRNRLKVRNGVFSFCVSLRNSCVFSIKYAFYILFRGVKFDSIITGRVPFCAIIISVFSHFAFCARCGTAQKCFLTVQIRNFTFMLSVHICKNLYGLRGVMRG